MKKTVAAATPCPPVYSSRSRVARPETARRLSSDVISYIHTYFVTFGQSCFSRRESTWAFFAVFLQLFRRKKKLENRPDLFLSSPMTLSERERVNSAPGSIGRRSQFGDGSIGRRVDSATASTRRWVDSATASFERWGQVGDSVNSVTSQFGDN